MWAAERLISDGRPRAPLRPTLRMDFCAASAHISRIDPRRVTLSTLAVAPDVCCFSSISVSAVEGPRGQIL